MLPFPLSVNGLYLNVKGRGRVKTKRYREWIDEASLMLMKQNISYFKTRVDITIHLGGGRKNQDCDNLIKCVLDRLVYLKILEDDCKPFVRSVKAIWNDEVVGTMVIIEEMNDEQEM